MTVEPLTARRLQAALATAQSQGRVPTLVGGVVRDGSLVWTSGDPDVQYRIGSITKTLTAVLVLQLRNEGQLSLGDPLGKHLPGVAYADRTLRSLLSHSAGMQSEPTGPWWERSPGVAFEQLEELMDDAAAPFEPGHSFHYTNLAFALLGEVVARMRGRTWGECVQERILAPLSMGRTSYHPMAPHAQGYSVHPYAGTLTEEPHQDTGAMAPAGQLWSTIADLARYATFLVEGHPTVLPAETLAEMSIPQSGDPDESLAASYGLGLRIMATPAGVLVGHPGSMPGFQASLFVDRTRDLGAVVLANGTTGLAYEALPPALIGIVEELEPTIPAPWVPAASVPDPVGEILGIWHWGNTAFTFRWSGTEIVVSQLMTGDDRETFALRETGFVGTSGYHRGERLSVVRNDDGSINHLTVASFVFTRTPYDPRAPIPGGHP